MKPIIVCELEIQEKVWVEFYDDDLVISQRVDLGGGDIQEWRITLRSRLVPDLLEAIRVSMATETKRR